MKYFYIPQFTAAYDKATKSMYLVGDSFISSYDGNAFTTNNETLLPDTQMAISPYSNATTVGQPYMDNYYYGAYQLTLNGFNDEPLFVSYMNNSLVALTRYQVHTSIDGGTTWTHYDLPPLLVSFQMFYLNSGTGSLSTVILNKTAYGTVNQTSINLNSNFILLLNYKTLIMPKFSSDYNGMKGYICNGGMWNPIPIDASLQSNYSQSIYASSYYTSWFQTVVVSPTEINNCVAYNYLNQRANGSYDTTYLFTYLFTY